MPEPVAARFIETQTWDTVHCLLCPHQCSIAPSRPGKCGMRTNRNGRLIASSYGRIAEARATPAEKLPLFHLHPGATWYWAAGIGCTMSCPFCNEWKYSQMGGTRTRYLQPGELVEEARKAGATGVFLGGNEPAVWHEYVADAAAAAHEAGLLAGVETSGMWATEPFSEILEVLDVVLFGFKGFSTDFWSKECGGLLEQARLNFEMALDRKRHVEISYLLIEGETDTNEQVASFGRWLGEIAPSTPVHLIRCQPEFHWTRPAPPPDRARAAAKILQANLSYVYGAEDGSAGARDTRCPSCGRVLVVRSAIRGAQTPGLRNGACIGCGAKIPIINGNSNSQGS